VSGEGIDGGTMTEHCGMTDSASAPWAVDLAVGVALALPSGAAVDRDAFYGWLWDEGGDRGLLGVCEGAVGVDEAAALGLTASPRVLDVAAAPADRDWVGDLPTLLVTCWFSDEPGARATAARAEIELTQTLPAALTRLHREVSAAALEEKAKLQADGLLSDGQRAIAAGDAKAARSVLDGLGTLQADLGAIYQVRVVYGPGEEYTGVFRIPEDVPGARNYYLIVEAVDPSGRLVEVPVTSEEDRRSDRVSRWGQRVSEAVFNDVAADKGDDQILQNSVIGQKVAGYISPQYRVETPGGAILEW
jgi:hypothetical protein